MIVFVGTSDLKQMKCFLNAKPIFELKSDGAFRDNYFQMTERWIFFFGFREKWCWRVLCNPKLNDQV